MTTMYDSMYDKKSAREYIISKFKQYYDIGTAGTALKITRDNTRWTVSLAFHGATSISTELDYAITGQGIACTQSKLDTAFETLVKAVSDTLGRYLKEMLDKIHSSLSANTRHFLAPYPNWKNEILTIPLLRVFYNVDIKKHPTSAQRLVTFTDKYTNKQTLGYFEETENGYIKCRRDQYEFAEIRGKTNLRLKLNESTLYATVSLDESDGALTLPMRGHSPSGYTDWYVVEKSDTCIVVHFVKIVHTKYPVEKTVLKYTLYTDETGRPKLETNALHLNWVDKIRHSKDLYKNPLNVDIHEHLARTDSPLYEGEHLWITENGFMYIKVSDVLWTPIADTLDWIDANARILPEGVVAEARRYALSLHLQA